MHNKNHPIWGLLNMVVILSFITLFSWLKASNFDITEGKMILEMAIGLVGWEAGKGWIRKSISNKEES